MDCPIDDVHHTDCMDNVRGKCIGLYPDKRMCDDINCCPYKHYRNNLAKVFKQTWAEIERKETKITYERHRKQTGSKTMKKNRSFGRNLKKQMRLLVAEKNALRSMLNIRTMLYMQLSDRLNSVENRIKRIDNQYIVSELERAELVCGGRFPEAVVRESMLRDIMYSEQLKNLIKVDVDRTFCGLGTRYIVSLQVLAPGK